MTLVEKMRAAEAAVKAAQKYRHYMRPGYDPMEMARLTYAAEDAMCAVAAAYGIAPTMPRQFGDGMGVHSGHSAVSFNATVNQWTIVLP